MHRHTAASERHRALLAALRAISVSSFFTLGPRDFKRAIIIKSLAHVRIIFSAGGIYIYISLSLFLSLYTVNRYCGTRAHHSRLTRRELMLFLLITRGVTCSSQPPTPLICIYTWVYVWNIPLSQKYYIFCARTRPSTASLMRRRRRTRAL